jgi:hypothetical protein
MNNILKTYIEYWRKYGDARRAIELTAREMGLSIKQVEKEILK